MIRPWAKESTAPPTIAVDSNPEALVVWAPNPCTDKENITANIMALHKPTATIHHTANIPELITEHTIRDAAKTAAMANTLAGWKNFKK